VPRNHRKAKALNIARIASDYNDPYSTRFQDTSQMSVNLAGIDKKNLSGDLTYGESDYVFFYPPASAISEYMSQITILGKKIMDSIGRSEVNHSEIIEMIAKQYQYCAII